MTRGLAVAPRQGPSPQVYMGRGGGTKLAGHRTFCTQTGQAHGRPRRVRQPRPQPATVCRVIILKYLLKLVKLSYWQVNNKSYGGQAKISAVHRLKNLRAIQQKIANIHFSLFLDPKTRNSVQRRKFRGFREVRACGKGHIFFSGNTPQTFLPL